MIEGAVTAGFPDQQFGDRTTFVIPEGLVQYQWVRGKFAPFIGGGIGAGIGFRDETFGGAQWDLAISGGGGLRVNLNDSVGIRADGRLRGFGTHFSGSAAELRGGLFWRF